MTHDRDPFAEPANGFELWLYRTAIVVIVLCIVAIALLLRSR